MPFSIKTKQVAAVTAIVGLAVIFVSAWYVSALAGYVLSETQARAKLIGDAIYHRMQEVVRTGDDPLNALRNDDGLTSVVQASLYSENVMYAAIVDTRGLIINHSDRARVDTRINTATLDLATLVEAGPFDQARALWESGAYYEYRFPLLLDNTDFGTVLVGISLPLMRSNLEDQVRDVAITTGVAILLTVFVSMLLAQLTLRPIHMIRTGLARLGRGETDVDMELPDDAELAALGDSFKAVTARLAADRSAIDGQRATLESVVDNLEDAVALFGPDGALLFANPAMEATFAAPGGGLDQLLPTGHPYRAVVDQALTNPKGPQRPTRAQMPGGGERLVQAHPVEDPEGRLLGVMIVARNLTYLTQVESTLSYSRKLAALGRLSAGIAHEVKNPLNATMIHLELLKMQVAGNPAALEHVATIVSQVRRLDEVVQGFLKFTRPEDLQLQAVDIGQLVTDLMPIVTAEAGKHRVDVRLDFPFDLPRAYADAGMLQQAFLNLALNACQAMPNGGRLRISGALTAARQIAVVFEDSGVGITPEDLSRIFDLYFTTKEHGSGIGLSLVYRTVQLHDGEIEVQSVPGRGTTFRVLLREAPVIDARLTPTRGILGLKPDLPSASRPVSAS
jgi:signal transduction histidine kinase